jgi:DNA polymerase III alpha subunit (gram-positive type)
MSVIKIIIFDTETHGLPKDYKAPIERPGAWPRILELGWELWEYDTVNKTPKMVKKKTELVKFTGGFEITDRFALQRFSTKTNNLFGVDIKDLLSEFIQDRLMCQYSVGHNISFDRKIIRAEMFRNGFIDEFSCKNICTMHKSRDYCNLYKKKIPSLSELHRKLFGADFVDAHNAGADVSATSKCFFELVKRNIINI